MSHFQAPKSQENYLGLLVMCSIKLIIFALLIADKSLKLSISPKPEHDKET